MTAPSQSAPSGASKQQIEAKFDLGIWHALFNWANLTVAIQNQWGGPDSADKRDWLAGAISEQFEKDRNTDAEDVEVMLLQVMEDEFNARVEDESEVQVAKHIMDLRKETGQGVFSSVDALQEKWEARKGKPVATGDVKITQIDQDAEWDSVDEESGSEGDDAEMADAPPSGSTKPKPVPEVDEDGFTKVVGKRRN